MGFVLLLGGVVSGVSLRADGLHGPPSAGELRVGLLEVEGRIGFQVAGRGTGSRRDALIA